MDIYLSYYPFARLDFRSCAITFVLFFITGMSLGPTLAIPMISGSSNRPSFPGISKRFIIASFDAAEDGFLNLSVLIDLVVILPSDNRLRCTVYGEHTSVTIYGPEYVGCNFFEVAGANRFGMYR